MTACVAGRQLTASDGETRARWTESRIRKRIRVRDWERDICAGVTMACSLRGVSRTLSLMK